jgi:hypothetical protein
LSVTEPGKLFPSIARSYGTEAAELVQAVKQGRMPGVPKDLMERCPVCSKMFHEMLEGRKVWETTPGCAVKNLWVKYWMENHDSIGIYNSASLDKSCDNDDARITEIGEKAVVCPDDPEEAKKLHCGLYCCDSK